MLLNSALFHEQRGAIFLAAYFNLEINNSSLKPAALNLEDIHIQWFVYVEMKAFTPRKYLYSLCVLLRYTVNTKPQDLQSQMKPVSVL